MPLLLQHILIGRRSAGRPDLQDVNNDGKIDGLDRVMDKKTAMPTFIGGFNAVLTYKQFDLSILFQGAAGAIAYLNLNQVILATITSHG